MTNLINETYLISWVWKREITFPRKEKPKREAWRRNYPPIPTYDFTWTNRLEDRKPIRRNVSKDLLWILLFGKPGRMVNGRGGRVHNSISSRWPPIKADEWEPFNGPSVNLHPWPYTFLPLLFNPFQHPFSISGTRNIPASLGDTSFLSRVSLLVNDARSLLSPSAMKLVPEFRHLPRCNLPLSTLGRLLVSLVTLKRAYVIRQPRENKEHHPRGF